MISEGRKENPLEKVEKIVKKLTKLELSNKGIYFIEFCRSQGFSLPNAIVESMGIEGRDLDIVLNKYINNPEYKKTPYAQYWYPLSVKPIREAEYWMNGKTGLARFENRYNRLASLLIKDPTGFLLVDTIFKEWRVGYLEDAPEIDQLSRIQLGLLEAGRQRYKNYYNFFQEIDL